MNSQESRDIFAEEIRKASNEGAIKLQVFLTEQTFRDLIPQPQGRGIPVFFAIYNTACTEYIYSNIQIDNSMQYGKARIERVS